MPTENPEVGAPNRLSLKEMLWHFLHFRLEVVTERLTNELQSLEKRIHILKGFALIFDALDAIIRIIRRSDGKADAAKKIMRKFPADARGGGLDEEQTDAILELKLYRLARLEINLILDELKEKQKRARQIRKLLAEDTKDTNASGRWQIVRKEIEALVVDYGKDHIVRLETRPANIEGNGAVSATDLVKNALRMRPERIIIGECRGGETLDMLQAMNTGHDGSMTTIHAIPHEMPSPVWKHW